MSHPDHYVAIFGGAVSGAEAAFQLAQHGIRTAVFDQNLLPYGKIEDGLPKWHIKLRNKEEARIDEKLSNPLVTFVPGVRLGRDISFEEMVNEWGFSAVLLAIGAWRDRPLPVEAIDQYIDRGLVYQNPFIHWFNHYHEPNYQGPVYDVPDGVAVVGGGLASIDVVKVVMILTVQKALLARGHDVNIFDLERSIAKVLKELGLTLEDLGISGCTLFYRRRIKDMPLSSHPTDTPEEREKAWKVHEKVLEHNRRQYLFNVAERHVPVDKIVEDGRLAGLVFRRTEIVDGRVKEIQGSEVEFRTPMVISSIGSLPEHLEGIPVAGQVYKIVKEDCCRLEGFDNVFALGNAVTGRGNILESLKHGRQVSQAIWEYYLADAEKAPHHQEADLRRKESAVQDRIGSIADHLQNLPHPDPEKVKVLEQRLKALQEKVGYDGNYAEWVAAHRPLRLETMLGLDH